MNLQFTTMNEIWEPHGKDYWIAQPATIAAPQNTYRFAGTSVALLLLRRGSQRR